MGSRFMSLIVAGTLFGGGPIFSNLAMADSGVAREYVIEAEPEVRIIESEPELRIIERQPEIRLEIDQPGHYERQRVLVKEGHFETYNVWVPKERKGLFGRKSIPGHYEARERWVAPQYEYREVWVPHR